ncbi:universal stress protein [Pseudoruegeria sp. SK021]|uniref:universal stress protein n=1 Tax=Pseudoruegeria sp. SK021 TaxID=1933035 RepID=UPI000A21CD05|nr:universal stress protein [Pseudoruegeria sp. SK021]OSP56745.1 universal stress protein [Pseudoruegeria sp. SK021]
MAYKTLLTVLRSEDQAESMISSAIELARRFDAHLEVMCLGIDPVQVGYYFAGADAIVQQSTYDNTRKLADATMARAKALLEVEDIRWSAREVVVQIGALGEIISSMSRFADLVVLGKPQGESARFEDAAILEAALFSGQSPVLVLPETGIPDGFGSRIVIGWNDGTEALNAIRAAMPLLCDADRTSIAIVDTAEHSAQQVDPGQALSTMLARHGVKPEIALLAKTQPRVSDVLLTHVRDIDATLMVTGAYGHSRFRQAILGGATREILEKATVPVLMAH